LQELSIPAYLCDLDFYGMRTTTFLLGILLAGLAFPNLPAQSAEFDASGFDAMRIENEIKLVVPREIQDSVWAYLQTRYDNDNLYLRAIDSSFSVKFAQDIFRDQYFDNDTFQLLQMQCGVRHRARVVLTDSTDRKNGRELMQIKINDIDANDLNRAEFKYPVKHYSPGGKVEEHDDHPFLGLVKRKSRKDILARLKEYKVEGLDLRPTILIVQLRKRVYVSLDTTAFATLTLDIDTAFYQGDTALFTEMEMELNEIRYTGADSAMRAKMEGINDQIKADLLKRFPAIHQDQTPKYNKAALALGVDPKNGKMGKGAGKFPVVPVVAGVSVALLAVVVVVIRRRRKG
jgi:hypothetical protein